MNVIRREAYVLEDKLKDKIDYVRGTNAVPIYFEFRDYDIPEGASAKVFVMKPSGKAVYNICTIFGQEVRVEVTSQMFIEEGMNLMQVQITKDDQSLVTYMQPVQVHKNFTEGDATESKNEAGWIEQYIQGMIEATEKAEEAAEKAEQIKDTLEEKFQNGDFIGATGATGPQGPQGEPGEKGEQGEKGERGDSGITVPASGLFTLSGDEEGNLWAYYADGDDPPQFEHDEETGDIYYIISEEAP